MPMSIDQLWANIQQGDEDSFRILYWMIQPWLNRCAFNLLKDWFLAEETVDDVFLKALENRQTIISKDGSLKNYLYQATHNLCLDRLKKKKTQKAGVCIAEEGMNLFEKQSDDDDLSEKIEMDEIAEAIDRMVEKMPERRRKVFRLSWIEGMENKEIAEQMRVAESTVRTHLQFAREEIEKFLNSIRRKW